MKNKNLCKGQIAMASRRRGFPDSKASELAMANNILARWVMAAKTPQSWLGRNPLEKKHQLAMVNASTREASW